MVRVGIFSLIEFQIDAVYIKFRERRRNLLILLTEFCKKVANSFQKTLIESMIRLKTSISTINTATLR
jgi:hypothetical protein